MIARNMAFKKKVIGGVVFLLIVFGAVTYALRCGNPNCPQANMAKLLGDCYSCS